MESYDDYYVSYDSLPYRLLAVELTKEPAHVKNPRDPALWTLCLRRPQIKVYLIRDSQVAHCHSSLASTNDAHYRRLIAVDLQLSLSELE
jgi:hypothetical protein